jgi:C4-dicarboxylate-specific signal transduction histidine kinase
VVADNLLANALAKRRPGDAPQVEVALGAGPLLRVTDRGEALPPALLERLFLGPVPSDRGLGVGLYQAAQLAGAAGWRLQLAGNEPGRVVFELVRAAAD